MSPAYWIPCACATMLGAMTGKFSIEAVSSPGRGADVFALVPARSPEALPQPGDADLSNVVPFVRPRASDGSRTLPDIVLPADAVRKLDQTGRERMRIAAF